jgi:hypothetical protein
MIWSVINLGRSNDTSCARRKVQYSKQSSLFSRRSLHGRYTSSARESRSWLLSTIPNLGK